MRIRGATTELEAAGLETEGMAESTAKLQEEILALSGVDIMLDEDTFKSTYQIMEELSEKWGELTDIQQASITELIAGKRQGNIVSSLMENFDIAEQALQTSMNSQGSAMAEHAKWMDSLQAKTQQLSAAWESLSMTFMSSDFLKGAVSGLTEFVQLLDNIIDKFGTLPTLLTGISAVRTFQGKGLFGVDGNQFKLMNTNITGLIDNYGKLQTAFSRYNSLSSKSASFQAKYNAAMASSNTSLAKYLSGLNGAKASMGGYISSLVAGKAATIAMQAAALALNMALTMGLSMAISAVVQGISNLINKQKEARESALEAGNAAKDESQNLRNLFNTYTDAKLAYDSNVGSKEDLESATESLLEALGLEQSEIDELIGKYGDLDSAIDKVTIESLRKDLADLTAGYEAAVDTLLDKTTDGFFDMDTFNKVSFRKANGAFQTDPVAEALKAAGFSYTDEYSYNGGYTGSYINLGDTSTLEGALAAYDNLVKMREALDRDVGNLYTREELAESALYKGINDKINEFTTEYNDVMDYVEQVNDTVAQIQIMEALSDNVPKTTEEFEAFKKEMLSTAKESGEFVGSQEDIEDAITNTLSEMPELIDFFDSTTTVAGDATETLSSMAEKAQENVSAVAESVTGFVTNLSSVQDVLNSQSTGKSLSIEDFSSEELKDYRSALEYVNGTMQLNAEKVAEITEAKAEEELAVIAANKAYAQAGYLDNASEIEKLRKKIRDKNFAEGETAETVQASIDSYLSQNEALLDTINGYDVMTSSIQEATSAYQHWLNAQNAAQSGDMFDSSIEAMQKISDTLVNTDSDSYGRIGNQDYKAAVDFVVPESVDHEDTDAVNKYMESIKDLFTYDSDGKRDGLDIATFCEKAVDAGLMVLDDSGENYQIAGQKTMEDFAEGLNLSLPLVQAMFGEMEEFGAEFDWSDEAIKTIGDLGVAANESAEKLRSIDQFSNLAIALDVSSFETSEEKISALDATIAEMNGVKAKVDVDSSEVEDANTVIKYCVAQKQLLSQPDVMTVDTSMVEGKIGEAISLLQEFQSAQDNLEMTKTLGMDTTQAQADLDAVTQKIQGLDTNVTTALSLDTTSVDTIKTSIGALSCEMIVKAGVDESAVIGFQQTAHDAKGTVEWDNNTRAVDAYAASQKYAEGQVKWYNNTSLVKTKFYATGTINWSGSSRNYLNGTAHLSGTANASGDWGTAVGGTSLVGELGQEIVVDPHTGRWYTVGDKGAEFRKIPKGAIVFNHKQTESLLANGFVAGRAAAFASGTAMVTGGISVKQSKKSSENSSAKKKSSTTKKSTTSSTKNSTTSKTNDSSTKDFEESFDWIEIALTRIQEAIDRVKVTAESAFKTLTKRNKNVTKEIGLINDEIELQSQAYNEYIAQANSVGLSETYAKKVRNGTMDISTITDEDLADQIKEYQEYYEKAIECKDAVAELHEEIVQLYADRFNNIQSDFEHQLSLVEHLTNTYNTGLDTLEAKGLMGSKVYYQALQKAEKENQEILTQELVDLTESFNQAMASGEIEKNSEQWYEMQESINSVKEALDESNLSLLEFEKTMRELDWEYFDFMEERISAITDEADFLVDLMANGKLFDDKGYMTNTGMATMGLHGQNYNVYMAQADQYANEIKSLNNEIANDPYNTDLIERRQELLELQREAILAAEDEKQAISDLVEDGINAQLDALKELIDTYTDSLDNAKDLYDYQKKVKDQTSEIASLQKQLSAYSGDTSEETRATIQKIEVDLSKAMEELQETEYDQYISDQKKMLDNLYTEYEIILNQRLDDVDALISDMIDTINANSSTIGDTIMQECANVGYTLTDSMNAIWTNEGGAFAIISKYGEQFLTQNTSTLNAILGIKAYTDSLIAKADAESKAKEEATKKQTEASKPATQPAKPATSTSVPAKSTTPIRTDKDNYGVALAIWNGNYGWGTGNTRVSRLKAKGFDPNKVQSIVNKMGKDGYIHSGAWIGKYYGIRDLAPYHYNKYAQGLKCATKDENAWVNELDDESIISPTKRAIITHISKGDSVLNGDATDNIWNMANDPSGFISKNLVGNSILSGIEPYMHVNNNSVGEVTFNLPNVTNYEDFMNRARKDEKFENMIQSMTIGVVAGKSTLAKNKYKW